MISIIIPFYNSEATLARTIESVLDQKLENVEIILVNDGSIDGSKAIAESYLNNEFIKMINQRNQGVSAARNSGAKISDGEYLIFLDSDDTLTPGCLNLIASNLNQGFGYLVWGYRRIIQQGIIDFFPKIDSYFSLLSGSYALRRELFFESGGFDEKLKFGENTELFHRVNLHEASFIYLNFLGLIYNHNENGGSKNLQNMIDSNLMILEKHKATLSNHTKHLFHQVIGVNQIRFRRFPEARFHLFKAYFFKPWKVLTLIRCLITLFPWLAKRVYSDRVKI